MIYRIPLGFHILQELQLANHDDPAGIPHLKPTPLIAGLYNLSEGVSTQTQCSNDANYPMCLGYNIGHWEIRCCDSSTRPNGTFLCIRYTRVVVHGLDYLPGTKVDDVAEAHHLSVFSVELNFSCCQQSLKPPQHL